MVFCLEESAVSRIPPLRIRECNDAPLAPGGDYVANRRLQYNFAPDRALEHCAVERDRGHDEKLFDQDRTQQGKTLRELSMGRPVQLVFLRHFG
jgi:hypothetical protein